jgi:hypothetical protein
VLQFVLKTHKLTLFLTADAGAPVSALKEQALAALRAPVLAHHDAYEAELRASEGDEEGMDVGGELGAGFRAGGAMGLGMGTALPTGELPDALVRPAVTRADEFELCRGRRERADAKEAAYAQAMTGVAPLPEHFDVLDPAKTLAECKLVNWEMLYIQFREASSGTSLHSRAIRSATHLPPTSAQGSSWTCTSRHTLRLPRTTTRAKTPPLSLHPALLRQQIKRRNPSESDRAHDNCVGDPCKRLFAITALSSRAGRGEAGRPRRVALPQ